ncbi:hypothetical protein FOZ63_007879, partial [Perkinsus olseni]
YVDDYFSLCDKDQAALCYQIFIRLNELLGFEVKREKSLEPSAEGKLLGILVRIDDDSITLDICPDRAKRLTKTIDDHLQWFRWAITACPRKIVHLHTNTPHVILYTDAEFSYTGDPPTAKSGGIGAVLAIPNHQRVFCLSWPLPADVFDFLEQRQTDIHPLEVMAIPIALHHWLTTTVPLQLLLRRTGGINISLYTDSTVAQGALTKGSSPCRNINNLVAATWKLCAENNVGLWINRVTSEENPADLPSRLRTDTTRRLGWTTSNMETTPPWREWLQELKEGTTGHPRPPTVVTTCFGLPFDGGHRPRNLLCPAATPHDISRHLEATRILRHLRSVESSTFKTYLQGARHYARFCRALE